MRGFRKEYFIKDYAYIFPPLVKRGEGGFVNGIIIKSPLIPLFQRGRFERRTSSKPI